MKCPVCNNIDLKIAERQGVEIDYCPECRGIWLDRGELDKIIERSYAQTGPAAYPTEQVPPAGYPGHHEPRHHDEHNYRHGGYHRKKSWLAELFD